MNMKKFVNYMLAAAASIVVFAACDLNLVPNSAIAYEEGGQLIQTASNLTSFENGILASYRSLQNGDYACVEEFELDCFNAVSDYGNNYGSIHRTDYTFTSTDYDTEALWANSYGAIKNYNIIIATADNVPDDIKDAAQLVKGEAYFFRAAQYLQLARHFGKAYGSSSSSDLCVPLVLVYDQNEKPSRATVAEVYDQIKADLTQAADLLKGVEGKARAQKPTIDAVNALFARYYLDVKDYANAAAYAHKVIDTQKYKLATTVKDIDKVFVNDEGDEAIMQMFVSLTEWNANAFSPYLNAASDSKYTEIFRPYFIPTKKVIDAYEPSDIRFQTWFDDEYAVLVAGTYHVGEFYTLVKFHGNPTLTSSPIRNARQAAKPFKIGEMYLIAAEAELAAGNTAAAKADLNALQTARGASASDANSETVEREWLRETIGEGFRLSNFKRWGSSFNGREPQEGARLVIMTGDNYETKSLDASSPYLCWPVPSHELKVNKNLVQNPGYDVK